MFFSLFYSCSDHFSEVLATKPRSVTEFDDSRGPPESRKLGIRPLLTNCEHLFRGTLKLEAIIGKTPKL